MDNITPNDAPNTAPNASQQNVHQQDSSQQTADSRRRKWVNFPDDWPQWLSKRVEISLPVWAVAVVTVVLTLLIFD